MEKTQRQNGNGGNGTRADTAGMVYGKLPPQAIEVEKAILGVLMIEANAVFTGMARLFPQLFYLEAHKQVFRAIQMLYDQNRKTDLLTVVEQLKEMGELENAGGAFGVSKLTNEVVSSAHLEDWISIISQQFLKREAIRLSGELMEQAYEEGSDCFDIINRADAGFQKIQEQVLVGMTRDIGYFAKKVLEQHATTKETGVLGIQTGIKAIDKVISGLVSPDLIVIAARPSQGKTALALSITYNTSVSGNIPCAWFSLEMDGTQLVRRLASIDTQIEHERIRTAYTTTEEMQKLQSSMDKIAKCNIHIEDNAGVTIRDIRTKANLLKRKHGIKFIIVDYIQLMTGIEAKGKSREQVVSDISRGLKLLAKELEIPVIALSQLSREVEKRESKMPQLSDLRESGAIEQDADEVIFLMRPEFYEKTEAPEIGGREYPISGLTIANTAKNRHGPTKNTAMFFNGPRMHFTDHSLDTDIYFNPPADYKPPYKDDNEISGNTGLPF